jgi:hypothetical protein
MTTTQGVLTCLALGTETKFRNTCRDESLADVFPSAAHTRIPFQAYVPYDRRSEGRKLEGRGGKVTGTAENHYGDVS